MQQIPLVGFGGPANNGGDDDEQRRRLEAKARRRKKKQQQRLILLGAFALAAILLVWVIVMIFSAIFGGDKKGPKASSSQASVSASLTEPEPAYQYPVAPDPNVWNLVLVNAQKPLDANFEMPSEQITVVTDVGHYFDSRAADSLKQMVADCNANVEGGSLTIYSGYRGPSTQNKRNQQTIEALVGQGMSQAEAELMAKQLEPPSGYSEHQTGLAVDFVTAIINEPKNEFDQQPEFQWLTQNAAQYGFILRYPYEYEAITGMLYQPYHWRYVGVDDALAITGASINLEQYLMVDSAPASEPAPVADSGATPDSGAADSSAA